MSTVTIRLPDDKHARLRQLAKHRDLSVNKLMTSAKKGLALPEQLDALVPQYLPQLPEDTFSGEALLWNASTQRLYSVGPDKKDHRGDFDPAHSQRSQKDWGIEYPWLTSSRKTHQ
jgi:hypothetical protein